MDRRCVSTKKTGSTVLPATAVVAGAAHSGLRGWRLSMEDEVVTELLRPDLGCFAVLDGHGGKFCSRWAAEELPERLRRHADKCQAPTEGEEAWQVAQQLADVIRQMDADLRHCGRPAWACGTTLVALLVTQRSLTVANVGDSRAVLCRAGVPLPLSRDHKPKVAAERQRILQAGGFIVDGRVNGDLSLSRALGDFRHKCVAHLPPGRQPVCAEPEVRSTKRLRTDHFVLLACDGVWDVMSSADAVGFVLNLLERESEVDAVSHDTSGAACDEVTHAGPEPPGLLSSQRDAPFSKEDHPANDEIDEAQNDDSSLRVGLGVVCEMLLDECIARGSTDNVSVVLVLLDHTLRAKRWLLPQAEASHRAAVAAAAVGASHPERPPPALLARAAKLRAQNAAAVIPARQGSMEMNQVGKITHGEHGGGGCVATDEGHAVPSASEALAALSNRVPHALAQSGDDRVCRDDVRGSHVAHGPADEPCGACTAQASVSGSTEASRDARQVQATQTWMGWLPRGAAFHGASFTFSRSTRRALLLISMLVACLVLGATQVVQSAHTPAWTSSRTHDVYHVNAIASTRIPVATRRVPAGAGLARLAEGQGRSAARKGMQKFKAKGAREPVL